MLTEAAAQLAGWPSNNRCGQPKRLPPYKRRVTPPKINRVLVMNHRWQYIHYWLVIQTDSDNYHSWFIYKSSGKNIDGKIYYIVVTYLKPFNLPPRWFRWVVLSP